MPSRKSPSVASWPAHPVAAVRRPKAGALRRRRKGNSHAQLTRDELEQMLLDAARMRASGARSRSGA